MGFFKGLFGKMETPILEEEKSSKEIIKDETEENTEEEDKMEDETTEEEQLYEVIVHRSDEYSDETWEGNTKEQAKKLVEDILRQLNDEKKFVIIEIPETKDTSYSYDAILSSSIHHIEINLQ